MTIQNIYYHPNSMHIDDLPDDVLGGSVFSYLIDPEDPRPIRTLNQVCKRWNAVMGKNLPYAIALREGQGFAPYSNIRWLRSLGCNQRSVYRMRLMMRVMSIEMQNLWRNRLNIPAAEARLQANVLMGLMYSIFQPGFHVNIPFLMLGNSPQSSLNITVNERVIQSFIVCLFSSCLNITHYYVTKLAIFGAKEIWIMLRDFYMISDVYFNILISDSAISAAGEKLGDFRPSPIYLEPLGISDFPKDLPSAEIPNLLTWVGTFCLFYFNFRYARQALSALPLEGHSLLSKPIFNAASAIASCRPLAKHAAYKAKAIGIRFFASVTSTLTEKCSAAYCWLFPPKRSYIPAFKSSGPLITEVDEREEAAIAQPMSFQEKHA